MLALATIASLAGGARARAARRVAGRLSLAVAVFTVIVVLSQLVNDPPAVVGRRGPGKAVGIWLALAGAGLMVAGAVLAVRAQPSPAIRGATGAQHDDEPSALTATWRSSAPATPSRTAAAAEQVGRLLARARRGGGVRRPRRRDGGGLPRRQARRRHHRRHPARASTARRRTPTWTWPSRPAWARRATRWWCARADVLVAVGGGYGTLSEIALALKAGKRVIGLGSWDIDGVVARVDGAPRRPSERRSS